MTIRRFAVLCAAALLAACGGGGDGGGSAPPLSCSVADQNVWVREHFDQRYFWYALAPRPDPAVYSTVQDYFDASLFGGDATFPSDRWSYKGLTADFDRFFGDGVNRGYGLSVAGLEVEGRPDLPLRVRYIEPKSDAAAKGLQRGDTIVSINGRLAAEYVADNDYDVLVPNNVGDQLQLVVRGPGGERSVTLVAQDYRLTPVTGARVVATPLGRKVPIDYSGGQPEIALRLQEMFGTTEHPVIGPRRDPLKITLLSPRQHPLQTTTDIPRFWDTSYAEVRKDMRGQYPRHPWPENPRDADPTLRAKPRGT